MSPTSPVRFADTDVGDEPVIAAVGRTVADVPPPPVTTLSSSEYLIVATVVLSPLAFTVPATVALVRKTELATPVVTVGAFVVVKLAGVVEYTVPTEFTALIRTRY